MARFSAERRGGDTAEGPIFAGATTGRRSRAGDLSARARRVGVSRLEKRP